MLSGIQNDIELAESEIDPLTSARHDEPTAEVMDLQRKYLEAPAAWKRCQWKGCRLGMLMCCWLQVDPAGCTPHAEALVNNPDAMDVSADEQASQKRGACDHGDS
jgi:hypothetical protein